MTDAQDDLEAFRTAARQREWSTLQDTLKRLLARFEPLLALEVAAVRVQNNENDVRLFISHSGPMFVSLI